MGDIVIEHSGSPHYEALNLQNVTTSENDADLVRSYCGGFFPEGSTHEEKSTCTEALDRGFFEYGCSHYRRRCRIRAPCCDEMFDCRHCHNESKNNINIDQKLRHEIPRHKVERIICSLCNTEHSKEKKLTITGNIDPVSLVSKLRKLCHTDIVSVGPAKEPEKKKDDGAKKDEGAKKDDGKKMMGLKKGMIKKEEPIRRKKKLFQ